MCNPNKEEENKKFCNISTQYFKRKTKSTVNIIGCLLLVRRVSYLFKWHCTENRPNLYFYEISNGPNPNRSFGTKNLICRASR